MLSFKDENKNKTLASLRKFPGENAYEATYFADYALDELLKHGAQDIPEMPEFRKKYLHERKELSPVYPELHACSGFTARTPGEDLLLCERPLPRLSGIP